MHSYYSPQYLALVEMTEDTMMAKVKVPRQHYTNSNCWEVVELLGSYRVRGTAKLMKIPKSTVQNIKHQKFHPAPRQEDTLTQRVPDDRFHICLALRPS